jgi:hypothetical protein
MSGKCPAPCIGTQGDGHPIPINDETEIQRAGIDEVADGIGDAVEAMTDSDGMQFRGRGRGTASIASARAPRRGCRSPSGCACASSALPSTTL